MPDYLDTQDACAYLDKSESWLHRHERIGTLKGYYLDERSLRRSYCRADLDTLKSNVTVSEAAHLLHVSRVRIWQLIQAGKIKATDARLYGNRPYWLIARSEVERVKREREKKERGTRHEPTHKSESVLSHP